MMKRRLVFILCMALVASMAFGEEKQLLETEKGKMSYAVGLDMGNNLKKKSIDVDPEILLQGIKDALSGGKPLMTEQELREAIQKTQKELLDRRKNLGQKNKKAGDAFLAKNKKKEGD
jgi:FKBP-type peptidyl-prolyl cis-trans isomerase